MMSYPLAIMSWNESFMNRWNVVGELQRSKNITMDLKSLL